MMAMRRIELQNKLYWLSLTETILGVLIIFLGIGILWVTISNTKEFPQMTDISYTIQGIWGGSLLFLSGLGGMTVKKRATSKIFNCSLVLTSFVAAGLLPALILSAIAANSDWVVRSILDAASAVLFFIGIVICLVHMILCWLGSSYCPNNGCCRCCLPTVQRRPRRDVPAMLQRWRILAGHGISDDEMARRIANEVMRALDSPSARDMQRRRTMSPMHMQMFFNTPPHGLMSSASRRSPHSAAARYNPNPPSYDDVKASSDDPPHYFNVMPVHPSEDPPGYKEVTSAEMKTDKNPSPIGHDTILENPSHDLQGSLVVNPSHDLQGSLVVNPSHNAPGTLAENPSHIGQDNSGKNSEEL